MTTHKARSLELFFVDGDPDGMLTATVPFQWSGHVLLSSRTQLRDALLRPEASRPGVYLLIGENDKGPLLYIGEGDDISQRIKNHDAGKDWWSTVVFITSHGDHLNKAHARYLESCLIDKARQINKIALENATSPTLPQLSEAARAHMDDFLDNIYLVLPALKFDFLSESTRPQRSASALPDIPEIPRFTLKSARHGLEAHAYIENGDFIIETGSKARQDWIGDKKHNYVKLHNELLAQGVLVPAGDYLVFGQNYAFSSPSAAGAIVTGRSSRGPIEWKVHGTEKTYAEWEREEILKQSGSGT
jgi:hypothetical protein